MCYNDFRMSTIDFHSHILAHMDDGAKNTAMSIEMLKQMRKQGTDLVIASSHFYARRNSADEFLQRREDALAHLQESLLSAFGSEEQVSRNVPTIVPGAEAAFFSGIENLPQLEDLCIQGTRTLLLEMPFVRWTSYEFNAVSSIIYNRHLNVVLAHIERYLGENKGNETFDRLLSLPVTLQVNAESLLPLFGSRPCINLFKEGKAQLLGSDAHNLDKRPPNLDKGRKVLEKKIGPDILKLIDETGVKLLAPCKG